jgi:hypothetical protein
MFFNSEAMLINVFSSIPSKLAMKGYVVRRSTDKTYNTNLIMVLKKIK